MGKRSKGEGRSAGEFAAAEKEILARRAGHVCSNPDCQAPTVGPAEAPKKAVSIGEAAHIYGVMPNAARYRSEMSDAGRRDTANGIWLCRNCHKMIDADASRYPAEVLFRWRADHERVTLERLGNRSAIVRFDILERKYTELFGDNDLAMQIAREQGDHWEYRLSAELLRKYLDLPTRRWRDLRDGLYTRRWTRLDAEEALPWLRMKMAEAMSFIEPLTQLYTRHLSHSWGAPGQPGDVLEIDRVCRLIGGMGEELVRWEEDIAFTRAPAQLEGVRLRLAGFCGHQFHELLKVADVLDEGVDRADRADRGEPTVVTHTIVFGLPEGWSEGLDAEFARVHVLIEDGEFDLTRWSDDDD
jgi:hypothetical protein